MAHSPPDSSAERHAKVDEHKTDEHEPAIRVGDLVVRGVFLLLGVLVALRGFELGLSTEEGSLGAGLVPAVVGSGMAMLAAALLVGGAVKRMRTNNAESRDRDVEQRATPQDDVPEQITPTPVTTGESREAEVMWKRWVNVAGLVALTAAIPMIGLAPAVGAYVLLVSLLIERWKVGYSVLFAVVVGGAVWLLFQELLAVPVPTGSLW